MIKHKSKLSFNWKCGDPTQHKSSHEEQNKPTNFISKIVFSLIGRQSHNYMTMFAMIALMLIIPVYSNRKIQSVQALSSSLFKLYCALLCTIVEFKLGERTHEIGQTTSKKYIF